MHDDDVDASSSPARIGLSIKGVNAKEIDRGDVIGATNSLKACNAIKIRFEKIVSIRENSVRPRSITYALVCRSNLLE